MAAFSIRVSQLRGGDTLRAGSVAPTPPNRGPMLPRTTRLLFASYSGTRLLGTMTPLSTRLI